MIAADVYVGSELVGHFSKRGDGVVEFEYVESAGSPVATTLPLAGGPYAAAGGALPPFFTNLLPEGRRLSTLKRTVKASLDDELALLLAVGSDTIGNVSVVARAKAESHASDHRPRRRTRFFQRSYPCWHCGSHCAPRCPGQGFGAHHRGTRARPEP